MPVCATRPTSFRPRSTSITCSAISFGSPRSSVGEPLVGLPRRAPRPRARDRPQRDRVAFLADQDLGRRADHVEVAEIVIEHVRRRIERAQRAIQRQRRRCERPLHPLRQHHLHHVARGDVLLRAPHRALVALGAELALSGREVGGRLERNGDGFAQLAPQLLQPVPRPRVGVRLAGIRVDDERDLAGEVVDDGELLGQQQQDVGNVRETLGPGGGARPASFVSMWRTVS